jgi:hypothetical protein
VVAQVAGSGTTNTIPQFTSPTTSGDSEIVQFNGNAGINSPTPDAKLEVKDFRNFDSNGQGPSAILGVVTCQAVLNIACAGVRGDANEISLGATGFIGNQINSTEVVEGYWARHSALAALPMAQGVNRSPRAAWESALWG